MPHSATVRILVVLLVILFSSCTDKDRFILIQNPLPDTEISILKESIDSEKPFEAILKRNDSIYLYDFNKGDKLYFKPLEQPDYEILPYQADSTDQQRIVLQITRKTIAELQNRYKQLPQYDKILYGVNILKSDPVFENSGLTKKIFSPLTSTSRNWQLLEESYLFEDYLQVIPNQNPIGGGFHQLVNSNRKLQQLIRGHYLVDTPFDTIISTESNIFEVFENDSLNQARLYSWHEINEEHFTLQLDPAGSTLNSEFVEAVKQLPVLRIIPDSLRYDSLPKELEPYKMFFEEWGTHYTHRIIYGPISLELSALKSGDVLEIASNNLNLKNILRSKEKQDSTSFNSFTDSILKENEQIRLIKKISSSSISDPNLHPLKQELLPIDQLLTPPFFQDSKENQIRRKLLQRISRLIQPKKVESEPLSVLRFKLNCFGIFLDKSNDTARPKNTISQANLIMDIKKPEGLEDSIWSKAIRYYPEKSAVWNLLEDEEKVQLPLKQDWNRDFDIRELMVFIDLNQIPIAFREDINFYFKGEFTEKDGTGSRYDDTIFGESIVPLSEMMQRNGGAVSLWCYDLNKERELSDLNINISFDVEVLPLY
ncbi:MAC/perforin domain-containing protein [Spongiivirga sp. MCCC 1A20706]|uniref:MAC/perforin domain-containing protein n=1 Tax=Spongiivirga sp. MCCC 1A20706 TaxID=3160963 RepID=UPI00397779FF